MKHFLHVGLAFLLFTTSSNLNAIDLHFYRNDGKHNVYLPEKIDTIGFQNDSVGILFKNGAFYQIDQPSIDSIVFSDDCSVAEMYIETENGDSIDSKEEYRNCLITIKGFNMFADSIGIKGKIRGRGNSTWLWYPKKAYKIKLDTKCKMLGLKKGKVWALMANYRDPTYMMNAMTFDIADYMDLKYTNNSRFCEVYVNNEYMGLYQLTEQIKQGNNRVEVNDENGILLNLDADDGPDGNPDGYDNFWCDAFREKYDHRLPVCIKFPDDSVTLANGRKAEVEADFNRLATLINNHDYAEVKKIFDIQSYIDFILIQDLTYNVELRTPRSMYIYKNTSKDTLWHMGPVWDFDGGFDFNWTNMTTSRSYFEENASLLCTKSSSNSWERGGGFGFPGREEETESTVNYDPAEHNDGVCPFFTALFYEEEFIKDYQNRWNSIKEMLIPMVFTKIENYYEQTKCAMERDQIRWEHNTSYEEEFSNLENWFTKQVELLDGYIQNMVTP